LLEAEMHPDKRKMLVDLLADEEAKHAARITGIEASKAPVVPIGCWRI
jgi:hypothetical protein